MFASRIIYDSVRRNPSMPSVSRACSPLGRKAAKFSKVYTVTPIAWVDDCWVCWTVEIDTILYGSTGYS